MTDNKANMKGIIELKSNFRLQQYTNTDEVDDSFILLAPYAHRSWIS